MKSSGAGFLLEQIDSAVTEIRSFSTATDLEKSYYAKFLVVFISGIYEEAIETIINERVGRTGDAQVVSFVAGSISKTFRNPDVKNVKGLLKFFKQQNWIEEIENMPNEVKDSLDSIINNKNALAHGQPCLVTLQEVLDFYNKSKLFLEKIDEMLL